MSLPVSHYEALLAEVRGLRRKAERVQQLAQPLIVGTRSQRFQNDIPLDYTMESLLSKRQHDSSNCPNYDQRSSGSEQERVSSEDEYRLGVSRDRSSRSQMSVSSEPAARAAGHTPLDSMNHGAWPNVSRNLWNSEPASLGKTGTQQNRRDLTAYDGGYQNEVSSVMSFASSSGGAPIDSALCNAGQKWSSQQLEAKMDVVNSLLSMLGSQEHVDMGETLLALSTCQESCLAMRQSGCIPLLVQLVQSDKDNDTRKKAAHALHNLVNSQPDEQIRKREIRILKLLEDVRQYIECLKYNIEFETTTLESGTSSPENDGDRHPEQTIAHLMKLSFDEGHRQAICQLGGIYTIATLVEIEHSLHGSSMQKGNCILMRRYACMALTNLTFGDSGNKTLLCSFKEFMRTLIQQLQSPSDELRQVTASVLRNLSWRADSTSKEILKEVGSVTGLMKAAMLQNRENTLKSILSALWNLSAHCTENKSEICSVDGGLGFIVNMLTYKTPSKSLAIIENAGGILRNISSQIAVRDDYREVLRQHNCLHILLEQLKSPSLTIVSNACGTLWNLSAKNAQDQDALWQMGAPAMLRSLNHSKHKMIAMGSSAALKNLLSCRPQQSLAPKLDSTAMALNLPELPTLGARKQKALMQDLDQNLSETYENIDKDSPVKSSNENNVDASGFMPTSRVKPSRTSEHLVNAFASLNLNEPSTSYGTDFRHTSKIPQNFGGSSLPYVPQATRRSNPASFLPVRTKFSAHSYEDDTPEQPIDYSRKYSETTGEKNRNSSRGIVASGDLGQTDKSRAYPDQKDDGDFNIGYMETDLDQPTDYSLRYADDDAYSDICSNITKQEYVQDTVKTYCTEGTPYETPFVFSNATSMSDLRNVGTLDDKLEIDNDIQKDIDKKDNKETKHVDEKDRCSTEDISEIENIPIKVQKSEFSSGMMSPEKPVNYCDEGTPGYFSRGSSFGSGLDSIPANEPGIKKEVKEEVKLNSSPDQTVAGSSRDKVGPKTPNEAKVVKFEQVVNYAEQTPLMFSRSSSLASLDSIEQHSIHDDRSSIVSDFSRLTSGIVSPSELPDSPTQTVPSSPRSTKAKLGFPNSSKQARDNKQRLSQKSSVFEDNITKFKEENTPIQFSTATSLSSLTIDDHEDSENVSSPSKTPETKVLQHPVTSTAGEGARLMRDQQGDQQEKKDTEKEKRGDDGSDLDQDDDLLAACINDGIQSNISAPTASTAPTMLPTSSCQYQPMKMAGSTGIPLMRRTPPRHLPPAFSNDYSRTYCTEDTPAELSRAGSRSNLSTLSIPNDSKSKVGDFSDDSSNLDEESEQLLAECIQLGMPKPIPEIKGFHSSLGSLGQDNKSTAGDLSDDSSNLSEDNEKLLQECIESGMPKPKSEIQSFHSSLNSVATSKDNKTKSGDPSEDSSSNMSGDNEKLLQECIDSAIPKPKPESKVFLSSLSRLSISDNKCKSDNPSDDSDNERLLQECIELGMPQPKSDTQCFHASLQTLPIPIGNKSSLSDDSCSTLSTDNERILLECIESGVPKPEAQFSGCRSSLSGVPILNGNKTKGGEFSDDSSSSLNTEQEIVLQECIEAGFPITTSQPIRGSLKLRTLPISISNKTKPGSDLSDDSCGSLNTEQERILQDCIEAGLPQTQQALKAASEQQKLQSNGVLPRRPSQHFKHHPPTMNPQLRGDQKLVRKSGESLKAPQSCAYKIDNKQKRYCGREANLVRDRDRREMSLPAYFSSMRDEVANYQEEDSPSQFSLRSSLSDLTVDGSVAGLKPSVKQQSGGPKTDYDAAGPSRAPLGPDNRTSHQDRQRRSSISSVSSTEEERSLLQECINAGMPILSREASLLGSNRSRVPQVSRDSLAATTRPVPNVQRCYERNEFSRGTEAVNRPKNVNAASVAGSTAVTPLLVSEQRPKMSTTVADVEESAAQDRNAKSATRMAVNFDQQAMQGSTQQFEGANLETKPISDTLPVSILPLEETSSTDQMKSGSSKSGRQFLEASFENDFTFSNSENCANLDRVFTRSCEESITLVDNRMLDPEAMIESLDRFTAELVSQASHLNKEKSCELEKQQDKSKVSNNEDNTWNDDSSQNELTFPTISGSAPNVVTFDSDSSTGDAVDAADHGDEGISNDFSSANTNTMTESTLIAIEASKMVTVFKKEAEMSQSTTSAKSLDLDSIMPPSQLNSLTSSVTGFEKGQPKSPKAVFRKKSLPGSLLVKRALSNSLNQCSSLESLYNNSLGNIEGTNPPSEMQNLGDMENSIMSVASLPLEGFDVHNMTEKSNSCKPHPIFNVKQQFTQSTADLEMVNPPSIFNDITDMCNSLMDVATEIIGTETSMFEDCLTHVPDDNTLPLDATEFSDANSLTPIQTDFSSAESTPKRTSKSLSKSMMTKQKRNLARDRYKTYVVAAEKVMQESIELETKERTAALDGESCADETLSDVYKTVNDKTEIYDSIVNGSLTYTVKSSKLTPKDRRKLDQSRFETRVVDESSVNAAKFEQTPDSRTSSASPSPTRSKLSIRRNFMQKRLENKERFRTQTLSESSFGSPEQSSSSPPCESNDIHSLVEKEANLVLKTIRDSKFLQDEMLDFETLSLVSNDDDSEHNFGISLNSKTYQTSCGSRAQNASVVASETTGPCSEETLTYAVKDPPTSNAVLVNSTPESEEESFNEQVVAKPKIIKPTEQPQALEEATNEEQPKGIRGRRKMLYSKANVNNKVSAKTIKPPKTMAVSSLVKNVTSSIKSGNAMKNMVGSREKPPQSVRAPMSSQVKSSGYGYTRSSPNRSEGNSPKHSAKVTPPLERQGTFTKDDSPTNSSPKSSSRLPTPPSKIPSFGRQIARAVPSKIPANNNVTPSRPVAPPKSISADRTNRNTRLYNRSTSADSREPPKKIQASSSTHSLKNEPKATNGALRKSGIPSPAQRSHSNVSIPSNGSAKKQVTSKIASLWKRIEESKAKLPPAQDKRVWIQSDKDTAEPSKLPENQKNILPHGK